MSEQQTPPQASKRRNRVAEEKAALRAEIAALANKVPEFVNTGSIQTTRTWLKHNDRAQKVAAGGMARMSRDKLNELAKSMKGEPA